MKKYSKTTFSLLFTLFSLFALSRPFASKDIYATLAASNPTSGASYYADNLNDLYYSGIDDSLVGEELMIALSSLTSSGFVNKSYSSLPSIYQYSDRGYTDSTKMQMVYTGTLKSFTAGGIPSGANKEHVWPASWYGTGDREEGAGSPGADAHNIWPSASDLNSKRGTSAFDELDFATSYKAYEFSRTDWSYGTPSDLDTYVWSTAFNYSNGQNDDILYPSRGHRGVVARILMYVATRYRNDSRYPVMMHDNATTLKIGRIGKLSTLLKWHYEEPPTDWEKRRNDEVAARWHHNRNPFVDHPEFATKIYYHLPEPDKTAPTAKVKEVIETYSEMVQGITLSKSSVTLEEGNSLQVNVVSNPNNEVITWSSSNNNVATVSNSGLITALSEGSAIITAQGSETSATISVTVKPEDSVVLISNLSFSPNTLSLKVGDEQTLTPNVLPVDATNQTLTYTSSNNGVAVVNTHGKLTGVSQGTSVITATTTDGTNLSATLNVTVTPLANTGTEGWSLVSDKSSLKAGDRLVIASKAKGLTAGSLSGDFLTHIATAFSGDGSSIVSLPTTTTQFTLGGSVGSWTLTNDSNQKLGTTGAKKLIYDTGTTTWTIDITSNSATITSTTSTYGRILYNVSSPRFNIYTSALSDSMLLVELYRYSEGATDDAKVEAYEYATLFMETTAVECASLNMTSATWTELASAYNALSNDAKDFFCDYAETDGLLVSLIERYTLIINKYNYTNFLINSSGTFIINEIPETIYYQVPSLNIIPIICFFFVGMVSVTFIYFFLRSKAKNRN